MITFVLLHYLVFEETIKCVNSILENVEGEKRVVIVDNKSPNDSFMKLIQFYQVNPNVVVLQNESNAGYASGINLGYQYAKTNLKPDFVVCMNNDMEIKQKDFIKRIYETHKKYNFYVMGPDIYSTAAKKHQNPEKDHIRTIEEVDAHIQEIKEIKRNRTKLKLKGFLKSNRLINNVYYLIKREKEEIASEVRQNVTLHGSCLVFSKLFLENREYALNPGTFFYCEAQILDYECLRDHMLTIYDSSIKIYHHEDIATDAVSGTYESKMLQKCDRVLQSLLFMRRMMLEDKGDQ